MEEVREVRRLVEAHGRLGAIARHDDRRLVEIVAAYGSDEDVGIPNFLYSGWCMTALPHSRIPDGDAWRLENGNVVLLVEPGRRARPGERSEEHTSELQSRQYLVCRLLLEKKKTTS